MLIAETLKKSILQAAIQGKLTEQLPSDGSAKDLLAKIKAEKQKLIAEGKIKKEKPLAPITDYEKPFEIPENWEWVRLGEVGIWNSGATPSRGISEYYRNGNIPWLKTGDLNDGLITEVPEYITQKAVDNSSMSLQPKGAVLIAMYGATIGKLGVLDIDATTNQACCACAPYSVLYNWYLFYALLQHKDMFIKQGAGGAQPNISKEKIVNSVIPLPPIAEQKRIVERVEELFAEIEKLEKDEKQLEELQKAFPTRLKNSLLQAAMQGKLTEQLPSDGNAKDLLAKIKAEKQKLIAEGKIKKEKPLAPITDDEKQFEIPENWEWVRFGELGNIIRGNGIKRDETVIKGFPCVRYGEIYTSYNIKFSMTKSFVSGELFGRSKQLKYGDVMFTLTGENKPDIAKAVAYLGENSVAISGDMAFIENHCCEPLFIVYLMATPFLISQKIATATGDMIVHISVDKVRNFNIPLPPIAEQKRIVEKLEELLPLCEDLGE